MAPLRLAALAFAAIAAGPAAQAAPTGSIEDFLSRAERLIPLGPLALAAPDGRRLKAELVDAARRYKARNDAQKKSGQPRTSCPPESGEMEPQEWIDHLRSYPAAQRPSTSIRSALERYMDKRFPCSASARTAE